jgi:peptide/nickel transport system substrate-binding protein
LWILPLALLACGGPGDDDAPASADASSAGATASSGSTAGEAVPEGKPERGDWLVVHMLADPENLNPLTSTDLASTQVLSWVFPSLLTLDNETLEQRALLAREMPQISEDKLQYTFRIRDGVTT